MNENTLNSNPDLAELLLLQQNFLSLVHSAVYHAPDSEDPQSLAQAAIKFQVHHISPANQQLTSMLKSLSRQLIEKKTPYDLSLRDCFQRLLQTDFLPLIRINRYELTKLSLFGFDIYVQPLEAFLQILSRLQAAKKRLIQTHRKSEAQNAEAALLKGWDEYLQFCYEWRISFNIYILDQYLRFGGKSVLKKDRQILFTGISNLYNELVPALAESKNFKLLKELASLNNSLYNFHPSFDYFKLFTLLLPLQQQYYPVFALAQQILQKCLRTNILTPLLFGLLRHQSSFLKFIEGVDSPVWLPFLNTIIAGITINLKFRILEYEEIIELFQKAVNKAGLMGSIRTEQITGKLEEGWKDAKEFFISAVKIGFNSGQVQTWKIADFQSIGSRILSSVLDGMLLNPQDNPQWQMYLEDGEERLSQEIRKLSEGKLDSHSVRSWICQLQTPIDSEERVLHLIRAANLFSLLKVQDQYSLSFIVGCILRINIEPKRMSMMRIQQYLQKINTLLCSPREGGWNLIKERVIQLHHKYPPKKDIASIIHFYFQNYEPKKGFIALLEIVDLSDQQTCSALALQISQRFQASRSDKLVQMKTFEKELLVKAEMVNAPYEGHCVLSVLASQILQHGLSTKTLIKNIVQARPSMTFAMLNFPINHNGKLFSLGTYLIQNIEFHQLLQQTLQISRGKILSEEGVDLIQTLTFPSICHHLCKMINEVEEGEQLEAYARLLLWSLLEFDQGEAYWRQLLSIYFYIIQKSSKAEGLGSLIQDSCILLVNAFVNKLDSWLAIQLISKIQGKFFSHKVVRKRTFKVAGSSIYFINQLPKQKQEEKIVHQQQKVAEKGSRKTREEQLTMFWESFQKMSALGLDKLVQIRESQNIVFQEESKTLFIPQLSQTSLNNISTKEEKVVKFIGVNGQNYLKLIQQALLQKDIQYLSSNRYTASLNPKLSLLLALQEEVKTNFLKQMCCRLSEGEKSKIADQIFFQACSLPHFVHFMEGIEFMALKNSFNWRALVDHISKGLSNSHLASHFLEYSQYISITGQANQDYQKLIKQQALLFQQYVRLLSMKLLVVEQGIQKEEKELRLTNELTFLTHLLSSLQTYKFASKLGTLHRTMRQKGIQEDSQWVSILKQLSSVVQKHLKSGKEGERSNEVESMLQIYNKELSEKKEQEQEKEKD